MRLRTDAQVHGRNHRIVQAGHLAAPCSGVDISPLLGIGNINSNDFSIAGLAVSLLGAILLLAIVNCIGRDKGR